MREMEIVLQERNLTKIWRGEYHLIEAWRSLLWTNISPGRVFSESVQFRVPEKLSAG